MDQDGAEVRHELRDRFPTLDGGARRSSRSCLTSTRPASWWRLAAILERAEGDLRAALDRRCHAPRAPARDRPGEPAGDVGRAGGAAADLRRPRQAARQRPVARAQPVARLRGRGQGRARLHPAPRERRLGTGPCALRRRPAQPRRGRRDRRRQAGHAGRADALGIEARHGAGMGVRPRVRLALGTPPLRPVAERLAWAYHGTAWVLGREAAATLPLEPLFGPAVRATWGWQAAAITRSLRAAEPVMGRDARVVLLLEGDGPESLVACTLGGVTAGYRMAGARLPEAGRETGGIVELVPPGSGAVPRGPRTRANQALEPLPGGAGDPDLGRRTACSRRPSAAPASPFSVEDAESAVVDAAVDVLKLRGEPVSFEGLLGEILVGLDRTGHLRRLVRPPASAHPEGEGRGRSGPARAGAEPARPEPARLRSRPRSPSRRPPPTTSIACSPSSAARSRGRRAGGCSRSATIAGGSARRPTWSWRRSRSPIASSGRCSASCPPPARCPRLRSSTASRACSRARTCPTRRSCGPAWSGTGASRARRTACPPRTTWPVAARSTAA